MTFKSLTGSTYIAGPIRGRDDLNWPAFRAVEIELHAHGNHALVPHRINGLISLTTNTLLPPDHPDRTRLPDEQCFLDSLWTMVHHADQAVLIDGWRESEGARAEVSVARRMGLPVFEVVYEEGEPVGINPLCDGDSAVVQEANRGRAYDNAPPVLSEP